MKNTVRVALVVGMMLVAGGGSLFAQSNNKVIEFPKAIANEKFTLSGDDGITYYLTLKKGDVLKFSVGGSYTDGADAQGLDIKLTKVEDTDKALATASPGEEVEYQVRDAGDYYVTVMNPGSRKAKISARISVNE